MRGLARRWRTWRGLPTARRGLLLRAALALLRVELALRWRSGALVADALASVPADRPSAGTSADCLWAAATARRVVPGRHLCLPSALLLLRLLHAAGHEASFHVGSRRHDDAFEAHAWVEWDDGAARSWPGEGRAAYAVFTP